MFTLGKIKDVIKEYEKKISQQELEGLLQEVGKKYGIEIKNAGNEVTGFIPSYKSKEEKEGWYEAYCEELAKVLAEKYK